MNRESSECSECLHQAGDVQCPPGDDGKDEAAVDNDDNGDNLDNDYSNDKKISRMKLTTATRKPTITTTTSASMQ